MPEPTASQRVDQVRRLLNPNNVVIVGATERATSWAGRIRENLLRFGFEGDIHAVNPRYESVWDQPCYPDIASVPEAPDHLVMLTPARAVAAGLDEGARAGARSATVFASGFGEDGSAEGPGYAADLKEVIARTGIAISGPNCLGNICASSRLVTLTDRRLIEVKDGPVAIVAQSGG
ncbi:MAG TPA: CoA-binding protein, partial [Methyloceanibacter sp.]|nr:CoA-binding protein [Methyloceanibacter sp.]